jgi:hypothetical protein
MIEYPVSIYRYWFDTDIFGISVYRTVLMFILTHPANLPCGRKPERPEKIHDFRLFSHEVVARIVYPRSQGGKPFASKIMDATTWKIQGELRRLERRPFVGKLSPFSTRRICSFPLSAPLYADVISDADKGKSRLPRTNSPSTSRRSAFARNVEILVFCR